jgi:peptidyl-prolyl cis-trans isomerase B (cyclophilin B)
MGKRNLKRERERKKALARQQRLIAAAKRRRRTQIIAGVVVAAVAVGGVVTAVVLSAVNSRDLVEAYSPEEDAGATPTDGSTAADDAATDAAEEPATDSNPKATYAAVPDPSLAEGREWGATMVTSEGDIAFTLDGKAAPQAVANFVQLARDGYYDESACHRVTTEGIWVLQCGSVTGDGTDSPGYQFGPLENVPEDGVYPVGTVAMARASAEDSQGSQFFIVYQPTTLPGGYSVFGHVTSGLDVVEAVAAAGTEDGSTDGRPNRPPIIERIELQ